MSNRMDDTQRSHIKALVRLLGGTPNEVSKLTIDLDKGTYRFTEKKGVGGQPQDKDTSADKAGWVYTGSATDPGSEPAQQQR